MSALRSRLLATASGALSLLASLAFSLAVTRRLPPDDLALLAVFNSAYAIGQQVANYAVGWYPRILAARPEAYGELLSTGLLTAGLGWAASALYALLFLHLVDPVTLALLAAMLALYAVPAGAYLSVHRQQAAAALSLASQAVKLAGAALVRLHPTAAAALVVNAAMALPQALAVLRRPRRPNLRLVVEGAPYQTLSLALAAAGGLTLYAIAAAGGDQMLYYNYLLFQLSKAVYPALAIVPLMYGSLLTAADKERRALLDGAIILYIYTATAVMMLKAPHVLLALLRPQALDDPQLAEAMRLNALALLLSGIQLHASNVLLGMEGKAVFGLQDRPARAALAQLALSPLHAVAVYLATWTWGVVGMTAALAAGTAVGISITLHYMEARRRLLKALYFPALATLATAWPLLPAPPPPAAGDVAVVGALLSIAPPALLYAAYSAAALYAASPAFRQATAAAVHRLGRYMGSKIRS